MAIAFVTCREMVPPMARIPSENIMHSETSVEIMLACVFYMGVYTRGGYVVY